MPEETTGAKDSHFVFQPFTLGFTVEQRGVIKEAPRRFLLERLRS